MAVSNVELIVSAAKAVNPLKRVQKEALTVEQRLKKTNEATRKVAQAFQFMGNRAKRALRDAESGAAQLGKRMRTVGTAVKAAGVAFAAYKAIQAGLSRVESERRLKLLARGYGEVAELQAAAGAAASKFNLSQTEANEGIGNAFARLRPLGVTLKDITSTFGGFRTAAVLGGATAQEASASFTQLSQALGSGALRGDEFRSVSEQAPLVLQAISDETGIAAGKLKEYAAEGLITSDIVIKALKRIETEGADKLAEALGGPAAAIKNFQNAAEDVAAAATETIVPQMSTAFADLAEIIRDLEEPIKFIGGLIGGLLKGISSVTTRLRRGGAAVGQAEMLATDATRRQLPGVGANDPRFLTLYQKELDRRLAKIDGQVFGQLPPSAAVLPGDSTKKGTTPLNLSGSSGTAQLKQQKDISEAMFAIQMKMQQARLSGDVYEQNRLERERETQRILESGMLTRERTVALLKNEIDGTLELASIFKDNFKEASEINAQITAQAIEGVKAGFIAAQQVDAKLQEQAEKMNQLYSSIGQTITSGIVDSLTAAVDGTKSLAEVASNTLRSLANIMLKFGINSLLGGLGGGDPSSIFTKLFGGGRASGGSVMSSGSYLVGERGPELFTPGRSGSIAPNGATGGVNVGTINIQVENTGEQLTPAAQKQLAGQVQGIVLSTLANERRSGGML